MRLTEVKDRNEELIEKLLSVWEKSVRETHLFLSASEIEKIAAYVPEALKSVSNLVVAEDERGEVVGFAGTERECLEMLFLLPEIRGQGLGRELIEYCVDEYGVKELGVNEQNPQARGFYEHMGFEVYKRTDVDEQGMPYPILYMRLKERG